MPNVGMSMQAVTCPNGTVSVSVPSSALNNCAFFQTDDGQVTLGTVGGVAPGGQAFFTVTQGYFFVQGVNGQSSYSLTQVTTGTKLYELSAAGATVTASSTETVSASATIPASLLQAGTTVRIRVQGIQTAVNSTDTCRFQVRIGPTTLTGTGVLDSTAVAGGDVRPVWLPSRPAALPFPPDQANSPWPSISCRCRYGYF